MIITMKIEDWLINVKPTTTITFFRGSADAGRRCLRRRVEIAVAANPWLGGRLVKQQDQISVEYGESWGGDASEHFLDADAPGQFAIYDEPGLEPGAIYLDEASRDALMRFASSCAVEETTSALASESPLFRVGLLAESRNARRFAVVCSMNHALGDVAIFHVIYEMLLRSAKVWTVDPKNDHKFVGLMKCLMVGGSDMRETHFSCRSCGRLVYPEVHNCRASCDPTCNTTGEQQEEEQGGEEMEEEEGGEEEGWGTEDEAQETIDGSQRGVLYEQPGSKCPELVSALNMKQRPERSTPGFKVWPCSWLHDAPWLTR